MQIGLISEPQDSPYFLTLRVSHFSFLAVNPICASTAWQASVLVVHVTLQVSVVLSTRMR